MLKNHENPQAQLRNGFLAPLLVCGFFCGVWFFVGLFFFFCPGIFPEISSRCKKTFVSTFVKGYVTRVTGYDGWRELPFSPKCFVNFLVCGVFFVCFDI